MHWLKRKLQETLNVNELTFFQSSIIKSLILLPLELVRKKVNVL